MTARRGAVILLMVAAAIYAGLALPARRAAAEAGDEYRRARERRREAFGRLARIERLEAARQRAAASVTASPAATQAGSAPVALRRSVLASLEGSGASNVRLAVHAGRRPVAATFQLSARGPFLEAVRLAGHVARPGTGIVLQSVRFTPNAADVSFELNGVTVEATR